MMHVDHHLFSRGQHSALKRILRWLVRARAAHKELFICATPSFKRFWCDNSEARQEDDNVNNLESLHGLRISRTVSVEALRFLGADPQSVGERSKKCGSL